MALSIFPMATFSQSSERFIRIVGNSTYEFKADTYRVYLTISEILPTNYNKEEYKSLETNIAETMAFLKKNGVKESKISKNYKSTNANNYSTKNESYYVDVTTSEMLNNVLSLKNSGLKIEPTKFLYLNVDPKIEIQLGNEAVQDAERKAKSLAKNIGKKVGKILNIEDKTTDCCMDFGEQITESISKKYTLNIMFELLD